MKQRIEEVCKAICQADATLTKGREEMHQLQHKLEEQNVQLQGKKELTAQKESLAECVESEQGGIAGIQNEGVPEKDSPDQEQYSAFRKHLGLGIICLHDVLIVKFTQINPCNPEAEYMVHLTIATDGVQAAPALPPSAAGGTQCIGSLLACLIQIRRLF